MSKIEKLLPCAIEALKKSKVVKEETIKSQFKGYISSFGASVISSGLLPTIAFYSSKGNAKEDRALLLTAISLVINDENNNLYDYVENHINKTLAKREIFDACIAIKLAIRTFKND